MHTKGALRDPWISPRLKIAALWTSVMFVFVYVDLFSLYRADVRADIAAGQLSALTIDQVSLLGITGYIVIPSLLVFLSLVLPARLCRVANIVLAAVYVVTIAVGVAGEWHYYVFGSAVEVVLLGVVAYYAWTWPRIESGDATSTSAANG